MIQKFHSWAYIQRKTWFKRISVQFSHSVESDSLWPHELQHTRPPLSITNSRNLPKLMSIELVMPSNHLILCRHLLLLLSIFPRIRVFSSESVLHIRWPKYWSSASVSVLPMNIQGWFPLGLIGWIYLQFKGFSRILSNITVWKHQLKFKQLAKIVN